MQFYEVNGKVHEFLIGDASHPNMKGILSTLNGICKPLSCIEEDGMEHDSHVSLILYLRIDC